MKNQKDIFAANYIFYGGTRAELLSWMGHTLKGGSSFPTERAWDKLSMAT